MKPTTPKPHACLFALAIAGAAAGATYAQGQPPPDHPAVTVRGQTYTPRSILTRNMGTPEDQSTAFPPHKIIGNIYYIGTRTLTSFLVTTPQGAILINTTYERNVRVIQKSVEQLGFKFSDIKIVLGNHAHGDHQEGDALVKELTGAQVMAMAEDVPALQNIKPGGKAHPIDRVLHDGDAVTLGGVTLTAHLTPGHTKGCTTWTLKARENGKTYDVVVVGSLSLNAANLGDNPGYPNIREDFVKSFKVMRSLPADVFVGSHNGFYNMTQKYARLEKGEANPFIDPAGYKAL